MSLCDAVKDTVGAVLDVNRGLEQVFMESSLSLIHTYYITVSTPKIKASRISHD